MEIKKYQQMMNERIEKTVNRWEKRETVSEDELYRFFHNVKGTSGTIGMSELKDIASHHLEFLEEKSGKLWTESEWRVLLKELPVYKSEKEMPVTENIWTGDLTEQEERPFILIIDDDVEFVTFIKDYLESNGFQTIIALTGEKGLELFYDMKPSLIILDYILPDIDGIAVLKQLLEKAQKEFTPIVMMSAHSSSENRARAYEMGAFDFIGKPIDKNLFIPFINNRLKFRDRVNNFVLQDELTGAYNRKYLTIELTKQIKKLAEKTTPAFSYVMVDLDHFKQVNDNYGHLVGDEVLKKFVELFKRVARPEDSICRYGGEEFTFILPDTTRHQAEARVSTFRELLSEQKFQSESDTFTVTFSAGIKEVDNGSFHPKMIMEHADKALYMAKDSGRNKTIIFDRELEKVETSDSLTIIIVDDDEVVRGMLTHHYRKKGEISGRPIEIRDYDNGISFLNDKWYKRNQQYIVLLDGMMPKMDGVEVLKQLRDHYPKKDIIVSMLTARKGELEVARALNLGADDYMVKPFNVKEVSARIDRIASRVLHP
ncbi:diguanylate cyclase [Salipaludibacillus neizhouensis]|uniref:Diguanylate cyclase n=1 Tax=Salipaludibacillus neizhouensis TaxID=885475 RepID=A0A3A9K6N7_9BACI|nr:diguanylate cyclase [Salipaludibacillus neizhouensis]RKL67909.1 diguanylate cyclase [Salipaludibacillus neizhouensis]